MQKYLVGGAVRDLLLNLPVKEKDWVITGSNPQEMLNIGYEQVGKGFPVFLHPCNHEEYALARTERKTGHGYTGFVCNTEPSVTIEEDLYRRDLTINAMAYDIHGNLLDPYNGQRDIKLKVLRHVSHAFHEDPLRVLRTARFAAKLNNIGFTIAPETLKFMTDMIHELNSLSPERVWMETKKALDTDNPQIYFRILRQCGALKILFPEINTLFDKSNLKLKQQHLCDNASLGDKTMQKLSYMVSLNSNISIRFAILCCDLGEEYTPIQKIPKTYIMKKFKSSLIDQLCYRLKVPYNIYRLSKIISIYGNYLYDINKLSSKIMIEIFDVFDCWKNSKKIEQIVDINKSNLLADQYNTDYICTQEQELRTAFQITTQINTHDVVINGFIGKNIRKELFLRRLKALHKWKNKTID